MKTFVIAQHHGVFLTLESMFDIGIDDITVIIPGSQVSKYNKMYEDNPTNSEFRVFKDYDKSIGAYLKTKNSNVKAYVDDSFDIKNTVSSTLNFISTFGTQEIVACVMSGCVVLNDYTPYAKASIECKEFGACFTRVYEGHPQLAMYNMVGLPKSDKSIDINFYLVDMTKITSEQLSVNDGFLLNDMFNRKQITILPRVYNGKDDVLIGSAISARQTIVHNLKMQNGFIANLWNKSIKREDTLRSEEVYGYPFDVYGKYAEKVAEYLPESTISKIITNGKETKKWTSGLYECLDIIDL